MSPDEGLVTVVAVLTGPILWLVWLFRMGRVQKLHRHRAALMPIVFALALSTALVYLVLKAAASFDVVNDPRYQFMYVVLGLAWLRVSLGIFPLVGLSPRDDIVERRNAAATVATIGAILGVTLCYAGGNIGDGPGWWVVVFSAALATATLIAVWMALAHLTPISDVVTIDRDLAAGVRLAALLTACGLILGRGVAGDWESAAAAASDFVPALVPVIVILVLAIVVERAGRPTRERPRAPLFTWGVLPAVVYLSIAIIATAQMGWPP